MPSMRIRAAVLALVAAAARPAPAQLPSASARALGLGDNFTALARGHDALAWNPAGLAMPDGARFSVELLGIRGGLGLGPIGVGELGDFEARLIPEPTKRAWLERISAAGAQAGSFGADVTYLSMSVGRIGVQVSTTLAGGLHLTPDAAELLLFGNAGRTGEPRDLVLSGSNASVAATSTIALGYARPLAFRIGAFPEQHLAVGATLKYTIGHMLAHGWDAGSVIAKDPLGVGIAFPIIQTDAAGLNHGVGLGIDVGLAWQGGPYTAGVVLRNAVHSFSWDRSTLTYRPGELAFGHDTIHANFAVGMLSEAPATLRRSAADFLSAFRFRPALALGFAARPRPDLLLSADLRQRLGPSHDWMSAQAATHLGIGAAIEVDPRLRARAGAAVLTGGLQLAGGLGAAFGRARVDLAGAFRAAGGAHHWIGMLAASYALP
ncbi:MAG TPA: conjugal transfer protein TraF [Longimicrobiales bacterium]